MFACSIDRQNEKTSDPTCDLILRCERERASKEGFSDRSDHLEASFEASASLRHLRMRSHMGPVVS
jgi:hypothetical protein